MAAMIDLSKAFNRVDHTLVIEDLHNMKCPAWLIKIIISYLTKRTLKVTFNGAEADPKTLQSGSGQGCLLGGILFIVKFNGIRMRPKIQRPILSDKNSLQVKYFDDATAATAINLKTQLCPDPIQRSRPLNWYEKDQLILPSHQNELQKYFIDFEKFAQENHFVINQKKTKVILFNMSHKYIFPPEVQLSSSYILEVVSDAKILGVSH